MQKQIGFLSRGLGDVQVKFFVELKTKENGITTDTQRVKLKADSKNELFEALENDYDCSKITRIVNLTNMGTMPAHFGGIPKDGHIRWQEQSADVVAGYLDGIFLR